MGKPIKFNLTVDGQGVRTLEELRDNFNIHDIIELYENGTLLRWLEVREYNDYAEKIRQINTSISLEEKAKLLFETFNFPSDDKNVKAAISALLYTKQREKRLKDLSNNNASKAKIISDYIADYEKLKTDIKAHKNDDAFINAAINELESEFLPLFKLNCMDIHEEFKEILPFVIDKIVENNNIINELSNTSIKKDIDDSLLIRNNPISKEIKAISKAVYEAIGAMYGATGTNSNCSE